MIVLAVSELATNLARYSPGGRIHVRAIGKSTEVGIQVESRDHGPGIVDPGEAARGGVSSGGGLGAGLAGVQRLMDEFELSSAPSGTTVVCRKWLRRR
jgi:serine/threonine-protein kinase RsbT